MAAQLMPKNHPEKTFRPEGSRLGNLGYTAYFGTYVVDETDARVIHKVKGALNPGWIGGDLDRYYEISGDFLKLSMKNADRVIGTLTWRRLQ